MKKETNVTIQEDYKLPSLGLIYDVKFDPNIKLRSMTVADEMKRMQMSNTPYKVMADIIDSCLLTELPISAYDMCLGDYQYLLHKLRIVTYGSDYNINVICPYCGEQFNATINLDELVINEYESSFVEDQVITLPKTGHKVKFRYQTPRDLDRIQNKQRELKKNFPDMDFDPAPLLMLESFIDTVDDEPLNYATSLEFLKKLPLKDGNILSQLAGNFNKKVGIDTAIVAHCDNCNSDVNSEFRFTSEFFRPTI